MEIFTDKQNIESEDFFRMCKKIAQLTKMVSVLYIKDSESHTLV